MLKFSSWIFSKYNLILTILILWCLEWFVFFEGIMGHWTSIKWFGFFRIPVIILVFFILWIYIWGISAWRRTLFGKFTRGDKKLWYKSLVSFWIIEISTVGGLVFAAGWISWGPKTFMPRYLWIPKKGFIFELTIFSYLLWLSYFLKFSIKWNLWKTQNSLIICILLFTGYLLWRDLFTLLSREFLKEQYGSRWKFIKLQSIVYSLDQTWWLNLYRGQKSSLYTWYLPLAKILKMKTEPIFTNGLTLIQYEKFIWLPYIHKQIYLNSITPFCFFKINFYNQFILFNSADPLYYQIINKNLNLDSNKFFPRRLGFLPKKIAMWYFLVILKMWHHLMLFFWWFVYLFKTISLRKTAYSYINMCIFNIFCCFLLGWGVYLVQIFYIFELYLRLRPRGISSSYTYFCISQGIMYCYELVASSRSSSLKLLDQQFENFFAALRQLKLKFIY